MVPLLNTIRWSGKAAQRCQFAMGLKTFWKDNKVLIVMGASLGLVHWGWHYLKSSPIFQVKTEDFSPERDILTFMIQSTRKSKEK
ncbi:uncharacterized protein [Anomalospiza imberbis]|uniref:uncharacterized protein n=1 Tax=Anomalospiza imberbis TaxID=187417 RepID=UPI00358FAFD5